MHSRTIREPNQAVQTFLRYAQEDEALKQEFENYLILLQQAQYISGWVERQARRGMDWSQSVDPDLLVADLILLMVSPGLLATGYCAGAEFLEAFERNKTREKAVLIPISLRPINLRGHVLESIVLTPYKPVSSWSDRHDAWQIVDRDIRIVLARRFKA